MPSSMFKASNVQQTLPKEVISLVLTLPFPSAPFEATHNGPESTQGIQDNLPPIPGALISNLIPFSTLVPRCHVT